MSISLPTAYKIKLSMPWGDLKDIVDWCDRNCSGDYRYTEDPNGEMYNSWIFFFENERDYVAFTLWLK
jgi:hypothetical protein